MKKIIVLFSILFFASQSYLSAQITWAQIGVDGLTCSACTRSVEMKIRKLDFVDSVSMNLEHTEGKIFFKKGAKVQVDKIAQAVVDAGFSVRYLHAAFVFNNVNVAADFCYSFEDNVYQFIKTEPKILNGEVVVNFIGEKFQSRKELKKWKADMKDNKCADKKAKVYFVAV